MEAVAAALAFIVEHLDLISLIKEALDGGADKQKIVEAIKASMVAAADAEVRTELGLDPA